MGLSAEEVHLVYAPELPQDIVREAIETQKCPWCSAGPFIRLAAHTQVAHRVLGQDLRRMAGYNLDASICSAEDARASRERLLSAPDWLDRTRKGNEASQRVGAIKVAHAASVSKTMRNNAEKYARIADLFKVNMLIQDIAAEVGMHRNAVGDVLQRQGLIQGAARSQRYANQGYRQRLSTSARQREEREALWRRESGVMTAKEAAAVLGVRPEGLRKAARAGSYPGARKSGRDWLIPAAIVEAILAERSTA
jgi:hypothetical protein